MGYSINSPPMQKTQKIFLVLLVLSALGLTASLLMTKLHYGLNARGLEEKSFCNVSDFFDCDSALASRYSIIRTRFGSIPTSELGTLFYLLAGFGFLYAWASAQRRTVLSFLFLSLIPATLYSLVMAYISIFKLGVLCLLCLTTYLCNFLLLLLIPSAAGARFRDFFAFLRSARPGLIFYSVFTLLFFVIGLLSFRGLNPKIHKAYARVPTKDYLKLFYAIPQETLDLSGRPTWGNPHAKVTVIEFSDFQCPFCRRAAFSLKAYLKEYEKKIRFLFVNYPLDNACNPSIPHAMHPVACLAAKASLCAHQQDRFWDYHDRVFENQKRLSRTTLLRLARESWLDVPRFEQCLVSDETAGRLKEDVETGSRVKVRGTPAVFINGRYFGDWPDPEKLRIVIEAETTGGSPELR